MSTPSNSASGNISPASITTISSPQRMAMQFMPNSPSPPSGTTCSFPVGIGSSDASTATQPESERGSSSGPVIPYTGDGMSGGAANLRRGLLGRGLEAGMRKAFLKAYGTVKVNPERYLQH